MQTTISAHYDADTLNLLDAVAAVMDRPRSALVKEAVIRYLDYLAWYGEAVQKDPDDTAAGRVKSHAQVKDRVRGPGFHVD